MLEKKNPEAKISAYSIIKTKQFLIVRFVLSYSQ